VRSSGAPDLVEECDCERGRIGLWKTPRCTATLERRAERCGERWRCIADDDRSCDARKPFPPRKLQGAPPVVDRLRATAEQGLEPVLHDLRIEIRFMVTYDIREP